MLIKSIAVFCGSQQGSNKIFAEHATMLGKMMAQRKIKLVYGGGNVGLMGILANAVLKDGGEVVGVIPQILDKRECSHQGLTQLLVVNDMHIRKRKMYELCDAAVVLPGGYGTMDELFEMITWNNLSIHDKEIYIMNSCGFYNQLLSHITVMLEAGFLYEDPFKRITILSQPGALAEHLG